MVRRVGRIVIAAAAIGAAVLVGNAAVSVFHTDALRNESAAVLHSNELLLALDNVLSLVKDAETGQRGYVITGRPEYLAPYRSGRRVDRRRRWMRSSALARDDPVQQRLMADMRRHVGARLGELELTIGAARSQGLRPDARRHPARRRHAPRWRRCARPPPRWPRTRRASWPRARPAADATYRDGAVQRGARGALARARGAARTFVRARASAPARPRPGRSA